ncbi:MAG: hypothetical protein LBL32_00770 [Holosporales bacterium]|nr:hypothetical protein [Holosporales bacterium]
MSGHTTFKAKVQGAMTQVEPEDNDDPLFAVNYYKIQWILKAGGVGLGIGGLVGAYQYWTILQATMNPFNFIKCLKSAAPLAAVTGALGAGYGYVISELGYLR